MSTEEDVLFPALVEALPVAQGSLMPLQVEHDELRTMLAVLTQTLTRPWNPARQEQLAVQIRDLVDLLRIHVRKEEALVFSVAERVLTEPALQRIAERLERPRSQASGAVPPEPTREESAS
jgi:hemerythrin-like domain-containing protein